MKIRRTEKNKKTAQQPALFKIKTAAGPPRPTPRKIPDWLRRQIEEQTPNAFGKYAHWEICPRCGSVTLAGWDAYDDYAGHVTTDPAQLDTLAELDAKIQARETFELRTDTEGRKTISRRDQHRIRASPATNHDWPVIPEHRCGSPLGQPLDRSKLSGK